MKTINISAVTIYLLLLMALRLDVAKAEENIIVNGNFDVADGNGAVSGWKIAGDPRFVKVIEENNNKFLRIEVAEVTFCGVNQRFEVGKDWAGIDVSAKVRLKNLKKGPEGYNTATILYTFEDAQGQHVGDWSQKMLMQDQDWTEVKGKVAALPPGAVSLLVQIGFMNASGVLDMDDVTVTPLK